MTWDSFSTFMQSNSGLLLLEVVCFIAGLVVIGIVWYRQRAGKRDSVTMGAYTGISLFSYARKQKTLLVLAAMRGLFALSVCLLIGKDGHRLYAHAGDSIGFKLLEIGILLLSLLMLFFIFNIFELGATHYILCGLDNQPMSMKASFRRAWNTKWMLFKFTVLDFLLSLLTGKKRDGSGNSGERRGSLLALFATVAAALVALSWRIATYFIMPVLLEEKESVITAIKKSAATLKNSFGRVVGFHLGTTALALTIFFVAFAPLLIILCIAALCVSFKIVRLKYFILPLLLGGIFGCVFIGLFSLVHTVMNWIFICVAYNYTQGKSTGPFDKDFVRETIVTKP